MNIAFDALRCFYSLRKIAKADFWYHHFCHSLTNHIYNSIVNQNSGSSRFSAFIHCARRYIPFLMTVNGFYVISTFIYFFMPIGVKTTSRWYVDQGRRNSVVKTHHWIHDLTGVEHLWFESQFRRQMNRITIQGQRRWKRAFEGLLSWISCRPNDTSLGQFHHSVLHLDNLISAQRFSCSSYFWCSGFIHIDERTCPSRYPSRATIWRWIFIVA